MAEDESRVPGIGLDDAIEALRADLIAAMEKGAGKPIQFPGAKMTVELDVVATKPGGADDTPRSWLPALTPSYC